MDYKKIYDKIIENRKLNPIEETEYGEKHHIIPRSLGGSDESENLVRLTAREHFICHALLAEMYERETFEWYKMNHAFMMMKSSTVNHMRYFNSRLYELKRKDFSQVMGDSQSGKKNSQYGKSKSKETKIKIRKTLHKTLGVTDGLTYSERKLIQSIQHKKNHTINGVYINRYRIKTIKKIFNIDLENRCVDGLSELSNLLESLYLKKNKSTIEISKIFNTNDETIRNYLKFVGIDRKSLSDAIKNFNKMQV
jgi:hypothetical protein